MTSLVSTHRRNQLPDHLANFLLPWEKQAEFQELLIGLEKRFIPTCPVTQEYIEQLALICWRRRRLRLAERAAHMAAAKQRSGMERADKVSMRALCTDRSPHRPTKSRPRKRVR